MLLYGRCSILGLDMNEITMLAWRMEEMSCTFAVVSSTMCSPTEKSHAMMLATVFGCNEGYAINDDA